MEKNKTSYRVHDLCNRYIQQRTGIQNIERTPGNQKEKRQKTHQKTGQDLDFTKEEVKMANNHLKRCSTTLVIREMQIRTKMSYHFTSVRMAKMNKTNLVRVWIYC